MNTLKMGFCLLLCSHALAQDVNLYLSADDLASLSEVVHEHLEAATAAFEAINTELGLEHLVQAADLAPSSLELQIITIAALLDHHQACSDSSVPLDTSVRICERILTDPHASRIQRMRAERARGQAHEEKRILEEMLASADEILLSHSESMINVERAAAQAERGRWQEIDARRDQEEAGTAAAGSTSAGANSTQTVEATLEGSHRRHTFDGLGSGNLTIRVRAYGFTPTMDLVIDGNRVVSGYGGYSSFTFESLALPGLNIPPGSYSLSVVIRDPEGAQSDRRRTYTLEVSFQNMGDWIQDEFM
jgi:hypothetical protein